MDKIVSPHNVLVPAAIFSLSASVILYEILLTRIFSVIFSYHYSFTILSLVMFGFGIGGLILARRIKNPISIEKAIVNYVVTSVGAVVIAASIGLFTQTIPRPLGILLFAVLGILPFIASGFAVSAFFHKWSNLSSFVYAGDMTGAAAGALASILVLNWMGPIRGTLVVGILAGLSILFLLLANGSFRLSRRSAAPLVFALAIHLVVAFVLSGDIPISNDSSKDLIYAQAENSRWEIKERRWSSFGRTDLIDTESWKGSMGLYVDGAAGTHMYKADQLALPQNSFYAFSGLVPLRYLQEDQKDSALIIGAGAGRDVIANLISGLKNITAVEVNPDIVELMKEYEDYNGGLYSQPDRVRVVVSEGRRFVRESSEKYDIIMLTLPITKSSRSVKGYALTENSLFTVEAFSDYLSRLSDEGQLIIVAHHDPEIKRLVTLALEAYRQDGINPKEVMERIYTVGSPGMPVIVFSKESISRTQAATRFYDQLSMGHVPGSYYLPYVAEGTYPPSSVAEQFWLIENEKLSLQEFIDSSTYNIYPVTDDSPFFYNFSRKISDAFPKLLWLLLLSVPIAFLFILRQSRKFEARQGPYVAYTTVMSILGLAYMIVEIAVFQRLMFLYENPAIAASFMLFALLLGSGIGGFISNSKHFRKELALQKALAIVAITIPIASILLDQLIFGSTSQEWLVSVLLILLGVAMGIPFPITIRNAGSSNLKQAIPLLWASNGMFSVAGAVVSMVLGMTIGFRTSIFLGSFLYLAAVLVSMFTISSGLSRTKIQHLQIGEEVESA